MTRGAREKAYSALLKGIIMAAFGAVVLGQAFYRARHPEAPVVELIGSFGLLALVANGLCLALLWRHRDDDINMSSVWLCSRNDIIANVSVLLRFTYLRDTKTALPVSRMQRSMFCASAHYATCCGPFP